VALVEAVTSVVALSPAITIAQAVAVAALPCMCFKVSTKNFQHFQTYLIYFHGK
jgi:hypothetical protein